MIIRIIKDSDFERFEDLFCDYYEELDCEDDPCHLFDEYVLPDLKQNLFSVAVAEDEEELIGFVLYQTDESGNEWNFREGDGDIREIFVLPSHRKKGVGRALIAFAEGALKSEGIGCAYALPTEEQEGFFIKCGYADNGDYCPDIDNKVFDKKL